MFKKTLSALAVACVMLVSAAAAGTIFPVEYTDIDGVTRAGYLDEAVIDRTGKIVIAYTDSPVSVDFSDTMVAYRYTDHSVYYATDGKRIGSYPGAVGFFEDGLLLCRNADTGLYSYVKQDGSTAFSGRCLCKRQNACADAGRRLSGDRHQGHSAVHSAE